MFAVADLLEGATKVCVTQRIDQRIDCGIEIAKPDGRGVHCPGDTVVAPGHDEEQDEVGQPGDGEDTDEHSQLSRSFQLFL